MIAGPTAVGKTAVALALAQRLGTEIISADSRQCYREMTIGTAKPSAEELEAVKHYFIDEFSVKEPVSAAQFEQLSLGYLEEIFRLRDTAVVCGGTGLYIKALTEGLDAMPAVEPAIEEEINRQYEDQGLSWLQQAVREEDPAFYATGEGLNPARLLRVLGFVRTTGRSILEFRTGTAKSRSFKTIKIALDLSRPELYDRINSRVDRMMEEGLLEEVRSLYPLKELKALHTVGYAELFDYVDGKYTLDEAVDKIRQHTRNYAKRQLTWFRKDTAFRWLETNEPDLVQKIVVPQ